MAAISVEKEKRFFFMTYSMSDDYEQYIVSL